MFIHNFKYTFKALFRNKTLIFWTFAFPLILGTFFYLAFSNLENGEKMSVVDIAIVQNEELENNIGFKQAFDYLSNEKNDNRLFNTKYTSKEEADKLLEKNEISGYVELTKNNPKVVVTKSDIDQTVIKYAAEEIYQSSDSYTEVETKLKEIFSRENKKSPIDIIKSLLSLITTNSANIKDSSKTKLSYTMIEFYTLIAMACLYGGVIGSVAVSWLLANITSIGKRTAVSSVSKFKLLLSSCLASYIVQLIGIGLLFIYSIFVLKVDYGSRTPAVIGLACLGCLAGLSLGLAVSTIFKGGDSSKTGILISITMLGCFFSGMMGMTMKYVIDTNIPIINKLNPAAMITDGFYALYYYDTLERFWFNILSLAIFSAIMLGISILSLRRQKYDSI